MMYILAWYTLPIFAYAIARSFRQRALLLVVIPVTMIVGYFLVIATVMSADAYDRARMEAFDLNRDGRIEGSERTKEAELAILDHGRDTGRALAPVLGIPITAVWYTFLYAVLYGGDWAIRKLLFRLGSSRNAALTMPTEADNKAINRSRGTGRL